MPSQSSSQCLELHLSDAPAPGTEPVLKVEDMKIHFPISVKGGLFGKTKPLKAVDGVSFDLKPGETLGVVGESGCGKSTLARGVLNLIPPTDGTVAWLGRDISKAGRKEMNALRDDLQIVFQDPLASLDPRMSIGASIAEPLQVHQPRLTRAERPATARLHRRGISSPAFSRHRSTPCGAPAAPPSPLLWRYSHANNRHELSAIVCTGTTSAATVTIARRFSPMLYE